MMLVTMEKSVELIHIHLVYILVSDNRFTVPQYYYEGQITGSTSWYNIGRILVVDTDTKSYLTNKISINTNRNNKK